MTVAAPKSSIWAKSSMSAFVQPTVHGVVAGNEFHAIRLCHAANTLLKQLRHRPPRIPGQQVNARPPYRHHNTYVIHVLGQHRADGVKNVFLVLRRRFVELIDDFIGAVVWFAKRRWKFVAQCASLRQSSAWCPWQPGQTNHPSGFGGTLF